MALKYKEIYNTLFENIKNNLYGKDGMLPTESELTKMFDTSVITVRHALELLVNEDLIVRIPGKGSFVKTKTKNKSETLKIGVVIPPSSNSFGGEIVSGIQEACRSYNFVPIFSDRYETQEEEKKELFYMSKLGISGVLVMPLYGQSYNNVFTANLFSNLPIVMIDRYLPGLPYSYIGTDNFHAAKDLTQYLFRKGHDNIAFLCSEDVTSALDERSKGFIAAFSQSANHRYHNNYVYSSIRSTLLGNQNKEYLINDIINLKKFFTDHPEITAVVAAYRDCANLARIVLNAIHKQSHKECEIVCFDDQNNEIEKILEVSSYTHIKQSEFEMGKRAVEMLAKRIEDPTTPLEKVVLPYRLIEKNDLSDIVSSILNT